VKARRGDQRAEVDRRRCLSNGSKGGPSFPWPARPHCEVVDEVVAVPHGIEANLFCYLRHLDQLGEWNFPLHFRELHADFHSWYRLRSHREHRSHVDVRLLGVTSWLGPVQMAAGEGMRRARARCIERSSWASDHFAGQSVWVRPSGAYRLAGIEARSLQRCEVVALLRVDSERSFGWLCAMGFFKVRPGEITFHG